MPVITPGGPFSHDLTLREWVVHETLDLSLIGAYPIMLRYEIEQYTDYTKSATEIIFNEYEFTIYINPCIVTDYIASLQVTEIRYVLNSPTLTDGHYIFDEVPFCGYPETVSFTNYA